MSRLDLPPLYEAITLDAVNCVTAEAQRRASAGADEGTLVWARTQAIGRGRAGSTWVSPPGGLYAALVLRPECPRHRLGELALVTMLSLGEAVAEHVVAMTDLRYRWPNDLLISQAKAGAVTVSAEPGTDPPAWVVLTLHANVTSAPPELGLNAASLHGDGGSAADASAVLESVSRPFLSWVNRWAEEGPAPVMRAWRLRADGPGRMVSVRMQDGGSISGLILGIDDDGALRLETDASERRLDLATAFGLVE